MTAAFEKTLVDALKSCTTRAWPPWLSTSLKTMRFPSGDHDRIIACAQARPVNAIVAPVDVLYIVLCLGPIMPGLFVFATGKRAVIDVLSAGSPDVSRRDPSG